MIKRVYFFVKNLLVNLLFPRTCIGCGSEGEWVCGGCLKTIEIIKQPFCPECRRPASSGEFCENCRTKFALDGIFICANFDEGVLREAIHHFKYNFIFDIGDFLGELITEKMKSLYSCQTGPVPKFDVIIPVPLHKKRLRYRGFNQAEILSKKIAEKLDFKLDTKSLKRKVYTTPQAELSRKQRLDNLKEAFEINVGPGRGLDLQNKNILLVDDITTTSATLEECAKILKQNGARSVWGIVLAKGK